jgi:hypothetical protein
VSAADDHPLRSDSDHKVLAFLAAHPLVLASHVQALLEVENQMAHERLEALEDRRLVRRARVMPEHASYYQITQLGLAVIGSDLPPPVLRLDRCRHSLGVAWGWLAGVRGGFGRVDRVLSEREQRAHDTTQAEELRPAEHGDPPLGVRVARASAGTPTALHYPDLLLIGRKGERVAVELVLTSGGRRRLETMMGSYAADPDIVAVLYLADTPAVLHTIRETAARLGVENLIHTQAVTAPPDAKPATGR